MNKTLQQLIDWYRSPTNKYPKLSKVTELQGIFLLLLVNYDRLELSFSEMFYKLFYHKTKKQIEKGR